MGNGTIWYRGLLELKWQLYRSMGETFSLLMKEVGRWYTTINLHWS